ncbi:IS5 family transposase [Bradyrhizobium sp. CCGB20]|uniref:IS5 family transposase n=1 Tax=Bradyrhizobium sp. CCGB20 TaxID=2949633 RepID=UPI0020B38023|nr:IS5 family transposase [Bradyrhizobium sp. CCGB20]MCP3397140.1 IS5 family transposase [Bradyrhizobium sp. CCGB20]
MGDLFLLSARQMARISPCFPLAHGVPRVDDRRVVSGIVYVIRNGLQWKDALKGLRSAQDALQSLHPLEPARRVQSDLCHPGGGRTEARAHHDRFHASEGAPNGCEPPKKGVLSRCIGRTKGGLNSKLHVVCNDVGKPLVMLLSEGQMSDRKGARVMLGALPPASALIADRGYNSNWFRAALKAKGMQACIPPTRSRKQPLVYDKGLYRSRHKIEHLFAKLKDWRRIATRYDRCAHTFFSAICIAASLAFYLNQ